ncbi:MAG: MerR family transcriptional regulator [Cytophagales bacterium]|nr:MerR family transcriptional regulator [Cytophagales bacterium]
MEGYSVKKLAKLAGVSVRTLHLYDQLGLLKPRVRTEARYRLYGEAELLRLQQILFYKELDFSLQAIKAMLDEPSFDFLGALQSHKAALQARRDRLATLLMTVDKTIAKLKGEPTMMTNEELYEGFPREQAEAYRQEAAQKWGADTVEKSENHLRGLGKEGFARLKAESEEIWTTLTGMTGQDPAGEAVQRQVARHYAVIRQFWGTAGSPDAQAEAYRGLGQLFVHDQRYTAVDGQPNPAFAAFMSRAMSHFADTQLAGGA